MRLTFLQILILGVVFTFSWRLSYLVESTVRRFLNDRRYQRIEARREARMAQTNFPHRFPFAVPREELGYEDQQSVRAVDMDEL